MYLKYKWEYNQKELLGLAKRGLNMGLFKSKYEKELINIISKLEMNMSNNYKDAAQSNLKELQDSFARFVEEGKIKDKTKALYEKRIEEYIEKMKGYTHKDQKPFWT